MPVAKRRVNPADVQRYYDRQGKNGPAQLIAESIETATVTHADKLAARRKAVVGIMVSEGLCKSLGKTGH